MHDGRVSPPATARGSGALPMPDRFDLRNTCPDIKIGLEIELISRNSYRFCNADYNTNIATIDLKARAGSPARQIGKIMGEWPVSRDGEDYCRIEFVSRPIPLSHIDDLKSFLKLVRKASSQFSSFLAKKDPRQALTGCDSVVEPCTFNDGPYHRVDTIPLSGGARVREKVGNFAWVAEGDTFSIHSVQVNVGIPTISFAYAFDKGDTKDVLGFNLLNNRVRRFLHPPAAVTETDSFGLLQEQLLAEMQWYKDHSKPLSKDTHPILPRSRAEELDFIGSPKDIPPFTCRTRDGKVTEGLVVEVRNNFNRGQPFLNRIKFAVRSGVYCDWVDNFVNQLTGWWTECIDANPRRMLVLHSPIATSPESVGGAGVAASALHRLPTRRVRGLVDVATTTLHPDPTRDHPIAGGPVDTGGAAAGALFPDPTPDHPVARGPVDMGGAGASTLQLDTHPRGPADAGGMAKNTLIRNLLLQASGRVDTGGAPTDP